MRRASIFGVWAACAALTVACGGSRATEKNENTAANESAARLPGGSPSERPAPIEVRGCLTAAGDRFVLTALQAAAPEDKAGNSAPAAAATPTTETYQLIAAKTDDLQKYVGQQVRVTGEAEPARVAEIRESTTATPPGERTVGTAGAQNAGKSDAAQPKVSTEEKTRLETSKLRVSSVTASGGACPAAGR